MKWLGVFIVLVCSAFQLKQTYLLKYPNYFPKPVYDFKNNPLTPEVVTLGRVLFYDPILSKNETISCASCHSSYNAFAHTDHDLSHGIYDRIGVRNAPALMNLAWHKTFMWDGAVNHLDVQALAPISHPNEMDESIQEVVRKLKNKSLYADLFYRAFHDKDITGERVLKALAQFQLTLVSANAKYDKVKQQQEVFTPQEENGYKLFLQKCNVCHTEPLFSNYDFKNNGLPVDLTLNDMGRAKVSQQTKDSLQFKVPTLRNLSYTFPYMHDGRFKNLHQVLNHYSNGVVAYKNLSKELTDLQLSASEKVDLIAFLLTLNDSSFVFNENFQFPKQILLSKKF